ncbi:MAG TPA: helix-turn-helix transcriptional regulator [Bdellovibrionales bacterium]|nr:helix-turn-helix transcriptional regulator [Bdellovibrionales bacterium]
MSKLYGLTQVELSKRVGMQPSHLNIFLKGKSDIHSERLVELLEEIGVSVEDLIDRALIRYKKTNAPEERGGDLEEMLRRMSRAEREAVLAIAQRLANERTKGKAPR